MLNFFPYFSDIAKGSKCSQVGSRAVLALVYKVYLYVSYINKRLCMNKPLRDQKSFYKMLIKRITVCC